MRPTFALRPVFPFFLFIILLASFPSRVQADSLLRKYMAQAPAKELGVAVLNLSTGESLFTHHAAKPLKPASTLKLVLTAAALEQLGAQYRFTTQVLVKGRATDGTVHSLTIVGGGDPLLTTEKLWILARRIKKAGIRQINELRLDSSFFADEYRRHGERAYEAGASALALNFNALTFEVCPAENSTGMSVVVDPWEYPVRVRQQRGKPGAPLALSEISPSEYLVTGSLAAGADCQKIYRSVADPVNYFGSVTKQFLRYLGVSVTKITEGPPSAGSTKIFSIKSRPLISIVRDLNHYSSNFVAQQLLTLLDERPSGPRRMQDGLAAMARFLTELGVPREQFLLVDASGLSHNNKLSAEALAQVVRHLARGTAYAADAVASLPMGGESGTLRERHMNRFVRGKTGTLRDVVALAGTVTSETGIELGFAVLQNGVSSIPAARAWEEGLVKELQKASFRG